MIKKEWFGKGKSVKDKCRMDFREQWVAIVAKKYNICPNRRMKCGTGEISQHVCNTKGIDFEY